MHLERLQRRRRVGAFLQLGELGDGIGRERRQAAATRNLGARRFLHAALASCRLGQRNEQPPSAAWSKLARLSSQEAIHGPVPASTRRHSRSQTHRKLFTARSPQAHADTPSQTQLFRPLRTHQVGRVRQSRPKPTRPRARRAPLSPCADAAA